MPKILIPTALTSIEGEPWQMVTAACSTCGTIREQHPITMYECLRILIFGLRSVINGNDSDSEHSRRILQAFKGKVGEIELLKEDYSWLIENLRKHGYAVLGPNEVEVRDALKETHDG